MATAALHKTLTDEIWHASGSALWVKRAIMVIAGIALLAVAAKIRVPLPYSPVPLSLGTFAVLTLGAAYGPRMGLATIIGYMVIGALGFDVFSKSTAELNGLTYMTGSTGGYLAGFILATLALGFAARRGWDRNVASMAGAMLVGTVLVYIPGAMWLMHLYGFDVSTAFAKGVAPFLVVDTLKLALAALIVPSIWKLVGKARS